MSFEDVKGQQRAIEVLTGYLKQGCLQGGYLFSGPEGLGKKFTALTLAKVLNCAAGRLDACEKCASCRKINSSQHPDVHVVECQDSQIKIESVRQLQREISLKAYEAKTKVFILDNAQNLTPEASGALLKILEEPPRESLIILISDKPGRLFKTIISRCKVVKFSPLARDKLEATLREDYRLDQASAHFLAYFSEGRIGRALKLKDTNIFAERNNIIEKFILRRSLRLDTLSLRNKDDLRAFLNILATWFRDIYLMKTGARHAELINFDRKEELLKAMSHFSYSKLNEIFKSISDSMFFLEANINIKLLLHNLGVEIWQT
jgi:DNA polymerase-3 subunit delta'